MTMLRWLAVMPCAVLAWYVALAAGSALLSGIYVLCPAEDVTSYSCVAWWYGYAEWVVLKLSVAASAFVVVITAAATAPYWRLQAAWLAYLAGSAIAAYLVAQTAAVGEFIAALIAGLGGVYLVAKRLHNTTAQQDT